jgi:hypothetical protein
LVATKMIEGSIMPHHKYLLTVIDDTLIIKTKED